MLKIAIADDEKFYIQQVANIVNHYSEENKEELELKGYTHAKELLWDIEERKQDFDIFFLDVEMGESGLTVAEQIRSYDMDAYIVFITNHSDYSIKAYEYNTYRYILKSQMEKSLPETLDSIITSIHEARCHWYYIANRSKMVKINCDDILYLTVCEKYTVFHLKNGEERERKTLNEVLLDLGEDQFVLINKNRAVNLHYITRIEDMVVKLQDGTQLSISRTRIKNLREKLAKHWRLTE